jgi:hypothetical protein
MKESRSANLLAVVQLRLQLDDARLEREVLSDQARDELLLGRTRLDADLGRAHVLVGTSRLQVDALGKGVVAANLDLQFAYHANTVGSSWA